MLRLSSSVPLTLMMALLAGMTACSGPAQGPVSEPSWEELAPADAPARDAFDPQLAGIDLKDNEEAEVRYGLAVALMEERAYEQALFHFRWLREHRAAWWVVHLEFARASYFLDGDADVALEALQSAVLLKPVNPRAYLLMGQIHEDLGQLKQAEIAYRQILKWRPDEEKAVVQLARIRAREGDVAEARTLYERILANNERHLQVLIELGGLAEKAGDLEAAEAHYLKARDVHPDVVRGYAILLNFYQRTGQRRDVKRLTRELEKIVDKGSGKRKKKRRKKRR